MKTTINESIKEHGLDNLESMIGTNCQCEGSELHHWLYNMDYFIIGRYQAKEFLDEFGVFEAIDIVTTYEKDNFGEVTTDISDPERLANMLSYVQGEEFLNESTTLMEEWDKKLSDDDLKAIKEELLAS